MKTLIKTVVAAAAGVMAIGVSAAFADHGDRRDHRRGDHRPAHCDTDHDHRSHAANYYDFYDADRYYRAGPYRGSGVSLSIRVGDGHYDSRRGYRDDYYGDRHYRGDRRYRADHRSRDRRRGRIVNRQVFDTRYRARIVVIEEVVHGRRGHRRLVCTVEARGPEARYVSTRRMHRIANRTCSPRARVRVYS